MSIFKPYVRYLSLVWIALLPGHFSKAQQHATLSAQERPQWFSDARFGMFIHWGLYSAAEGIWEGERLRNANNYAEWIRYRNRIPAEAYGHLAERFNYDDIHPEAWVLLAKKAGMKYIVVTAKHHDGVAIWNSQVSEYTLPKLSHSNRDIIAELAAACRKHGMKLGFYYSHWIDWEHPYGWNHNMELTGKVTDAQYDQYWQKKVIPQLRELLTNYGDIALLWFDMWIPHERTVVKTAQLEQVISLVRQLQPNCLVNSRLGLPATHEGIDFETLGDNSFGAVYKDHPWETPGTIAHSWGYNALEDEWKSTSQLLHNLISNVSLNGDFTLNIGPRADGSIPYESSSRLDEIGRWLEINGESVYGGGGIALSPNQHDWGKITHKKRENGSDNLYLQVFNWPLDKNLHVSGILSQPKRVYLLSDKLKAAVDFEQEGPNLLIHLPQTAPDPFVSVVALEFDGEVQLDKEVVAESSFGGYALNSQNFIRTSPDVKKQAADGDRPEHLVISQPTTLTWKFYSAQPEDFFCNISYNSPSKEGAGIRVQSDGVDISSKLEPNGKVVVEPNSNYYTDEFREQRLGKVAFGQAGYHEIKITINPAKGEQVLFNHLWLSPKQ